jgi:hypothetical protein
MGGRGCPRGLVIRSISKSALAGLWKGAGGWSYRLRPKVAGETAGEGTLATSEGAIVGANGGSVECIILVDETGCRVEKSWRGVRGRDTPDDKHLSDGLVLALPCKSAGLVYGLWGKIADYTWGDVCGICNTPKPRVI